MKKLLTEPAIKFQGELRKIMKVIGQEFKDEIKRIIFTIEERRRADEIKLIIYIEPSRNLTPEEALEALKRVWGWQLENQSKTLQRLVIVSLH